MFNQQPHQALGVEDEFVPGRVLVPVEGGHPREMRAESLLHPRTAKGAPEEGRHGQRATWNLVVGTWKLSGRRYS